MQGLYEWEWNDHRGQHKADPCLLSPTGPFLPWTNRIRWWAHSAPDSPLQTFIYIYIYIYAFSRRFYPKRLTLHSCYSFTFDQLLLSLGIEPMILALLAPCSTIWATGKLIALQPSQCLLGVTREACQFVLLALQSTWLVCFHVFTYQCHDNAIGLGPRCWEEQYWPISQIHWEGRMSGRLIIFTDTGWCGAEWWPPGWWALFREEYTQREKRTDKLDVNVKKNVNCLHWCL